VQKNDHVGMHWEMCSKRQSWLTTEVARMRERERGGGGEREGAGERWRKMERDGERGVEKV